MDFFIYTKYFTLSNSVLIQLYHFNNSKIAVCLKDVIEHVNYSQTVILDLRNCTGGNIENAVRVAEIFVSNTIELPYEIKSNSNTFKRVIHGRNKNTKVIVLVGEHTLSSGEFILFYSTKLDGILSFGKRTGGHSGQSITKQITRTNTFSYTVRRYYDHDKELISGLEPDIVITPDLCDIVRKNDFLLDTIQRNYAT